MPLSAPVGSSVAVMKVRRLSGMYGLLRSMRKFGISADGSGTGLSTEVTCTFE